MFLSKLWLSLKLKVCYTPNQIDFSQPGADTQPVGAKHIHLQPQDIPGLYMIQYQQSFKCLKIALSYFFFISNNQRRWSMFFQSSLDSGSIRLSASITGQLSNRLFSCFDFCLLRKVKRIKFFVYVYFIFSEGLILIDWASNLQLL